MTMLSTKALITYIINTAKHFFVFFMRYGKNQKRLVMFDKIFIAGEENSKLIALVHAQPIIYKIETCFHLLSSFAQKYQQNTSMRKNVMHLPVTL